MTLLVRWRYPELSFGFSSKTLVTILLPAFLIFLLGIYDDIRGVGPYCKFAVQTIAAVMLFAGGLRILNLPVLFGSHHFSWFVGLPLTILWVLAITNAFNLIDGLDGLAAGSALFSTLVVFVVALLSHSTLVSLLTIALAGAILGFLRFNFNPATIFLGDCGSLFIGFMLSALALAIVFAGAAMLAAQSPRFEVGRPPTPDEVRGLGAAIAPDGGGLPDGSGTVAEGRTVYAARCASCHGPTMQGGAATSLVDGVWKFGAMIMSDARDSKDDQPQVVAGASAGDGSRAKWTPSSLSSSPI
jgi:mono/diheme cytochrome c family protein